MKFDKSIRALLANAGRIAEHKDARCAWARETTAALREAQRAMDRRCDEAVGRLSEEAFHRLFEAEQAKVNAIRATLDAVIERDLWPRELYFGGI
jgi:hypothetical protein